MARKMRRMILTGFVAGVVGVVVFHQGVILLMHVLGLLPFAPFSMRPTEPFGVPQLISLAFWGGLWGIVLVVFMTSVRGADRLWVAVLFGGVLPSLVGIFVVTPLKSGDPAAWMQVPMLLRAFVSTGQGLGTALAYRVARRVLR